MGEIETYFEEEIRALINLNPSRCQGAIFGADDFVFISERVCRCTGALEHMCTCALEHSALEHLCTGAFVQPISRGPDV